MERDTTCGSAADNPQAVEDFEISPEDLQPSRGYAAADVPPRDEAAEQSSDPEEYL